MYGKINTGGKKPEGQYVWEKSLINETVVRIDVTQTSGSNPFKFKLASTDVDLTTVDASFFTGLSFVCNNYTLEFTDSSNCKFRSSAFTKSGTFTYSASSCVISANITSQSSIDIFEWNSVEIVDTSYEGVGYAVSSDIASYPDGGEQNGYWYEAIVSNDKKIPEYGILFNHVNADGYPTKLFVKIPFIVRDYRTFSEEWGPEVMDYLEEMTLECNLSTKSAFGELCDRFFGKIKVKTNIMPAKACHYMGEHVSEPLIPEEKRKKAVWLAKTVETIEDGGTKYNSGNPFYGAKGATIYCEATERQAGWETYWNYAGTSSSETLVLTTYYGITEDAFDAL